MKKDLKKEYHLRFLVVTLGAIALSMGVWILSHSPALITLLSKEHLYKEQADQIINSELSADKEVLRNLITEVNKKTELLSVSSVSASGAVQDIVRNTVAGVGINIFEFKPQEGVPIVAIQGTASTRADLLALRRSLESVEGVASVDLPFSNFTQEVDIQFKMNIILDVEEGKTKNN